MEWVGHVTHMKEMKNAFKIWLEGLKGRDCLEHLGVKGKLILKWTSVIFLIRKIV